MMYIVNMETINIEDIENVEDDKGTGYAYSHTELGQDAILKEAKRLEAEDGLSPDDAIRVAAATMDGAGDHEGETVESMQTCMDLFGKPVKGLSTSDIPVSRKDKYAATEARRHEAADRNVDPAAMWLKLSGIPGGRPVADKIIELISSGQEKASRYWNIIKACAEKNLTDSEIINILSETVNPKQ